MVIDSRLRGQLRQLGTVKVRAEVNMVVNSLFGEGGQQLGTDAFTSCWNDIRLRLGIYIYWVLRVIDWIT